MNSHALWLLCLLGVALLNQGACGPNAEEEYPQDGDGEGDYDDEEYTEDTGPPPVIKSTSIELILEVGQDAVFPCNVEGNPELFSRIWRKDATGLFVGTVRQTNNARINNLKNGDLEIRHVEDSDNGLYSCMISVAGKPQEVTHILKVKSPARITKVTPLGETVSVKQTSALTLECIAQGYPAPTISWYRNGHILEDQDPSIHGARYIISNASTADAGNYTCTATNGQELPDEKTIEVQIHFPPEIKIARGVVTSGDNIESVLMCTVTGLKKPEVKWYKDIDANPIVPSKKIKLEKKGHDHILRILKTKATDFGDYRCEATNAEGETSAVIRLTGKPTRPIIVSDETPTDTYTNSPVLVYKVESYSPIEEYELLYKRDNSDEWLAVKPVVVPAEGYEYTVKYVVTGLQPGVYEAQLKAKNGFGWSEFSTQQTFVKEHEGDLTETGLLAISEQSSSSELRISVALLVSLLIARFYC